MFTIDMLPANEGDSLWIEYGPDGGPVSRVLIDCGRKTAYRAVAKRLKDKPDLEFELFVLTHVDGDHIAGAVPLLQDKHFGPERVGDVWFNGWRHLNHQHRDPDGPKIMGARQGEYFGAVLRDAKYPWNEAFAGFAAVVENDAELPTKTLPGGMVLTLLSPTWEKLDDMRARWQKDLRTNDPKKQIEPGDWERAMELLGDDRRYGPDTLSGGHEGPIVVSTLGQAPFEADGSEPNGSSIAFLAEYEGKAVLFAGDTHAPQLAASVQRLIDARGVDLLKLDALKMSHHGSARNNSMALLETLDCKRYLLSTNGSRHHHPDPETLARVLTLYDEGVEFTFNYRSEESTVWDDPDLKGRHKYEAVYPAETGISVTV